MKDIRVDSEGELRCWNCGNRGLLEKRTFRSKAVIGVGALLTKKKLKCQTCGEYNDAGTAKPYTGPASRKWRKVWEKSEQVKTVTQLGAESRQAQLNANAIAEALVVAAGGLVTRGNDQLEPAALAISTPATPPADPPPPPPGWRADPTARHEVRYWDGSRWTEHVSNQGEQSTDPSS